MSSAGALTARSKEDDVLSFDTAAVETAQNGAGMSAAQTTDLSDAILALILETLDSEKAEDIVQIDLRGRSSMGDHMVICSGRSSRQVAALSEKLVEKILRLYRQGRGQGYR